MVRRLIRTSASSQFVSSCCWLIGILLTVSRWALLFCWLLIFTTLILGGLRANSDVDDRHRKRDLHAWDFGSFQCQHVEGQLLIIPLAAHRAHRFGNFPGAVAGSPGGSLWVDTVAQAVHDWRLEPFIVALRWSAEIETLPEVAVETLEVSQPKVVAKLS